MRNSVCRGVHSGCWDCRSCTQRCRAHAAELLAWADASEDAFKASASAWVMGNSGLTQGGWQTDRDGGNIS